MLTVFLKRCGTTWKVHGDHVMLMPPIESSGKPFKAKLPHGFETDLDTIPRVPVFYSWLKNRTAAASVWHDFLYKSGYPRDWADAMFLELMRQEGVRRRYRIPIFWGVRIFGYFVYQRKYKVLPWYRKHFES